MGLGLTPTAAVDVLKLGLNIRIRFTVPLSPFLLREHYNMRSILLGRVSVPYKRDHDHESFSATKASPSSVVIVARKM